MPKGLYSIRSRGFLFVGGRILPNHNDICITTFEFLHFDTYILGDVYWVFLKTKTQNIDRLKVLVLV